MHPVRATLLIVVTAAAILTPVARSEQLGTYGNTWEITELDAVESIKNRLTKMDKAGKMKEFWEDYRDKQLDGVNNPQPIPGISKVKEAKTWTFDPTYTFAETAKDNLGNVLVPAGTKINPLDYTQLSKAIVFIDGRDEAQVAYARQRTDANPKDKVVLVGGSYVKLTREWKRPVYFDQRGILVEHFNIKRVPAVLSQRGKQLVIEELAL
jgi:conjugal transfer pilus assembly protein TraW